MLNALIFANIVCIIFFCLLYLAITKGKVFAILLIIVSIIVMGYGVARFIAEGGVGHGALSGLVVFVGGIVIALPGIVGLVVKLKNAPK